MNEDETARFLACFKEMKVKKRQFIVQPGFTAKYRNYLLEGSLMGYLIAGEGVDNIIALAIEDWWILDYNSYIFQQPATSL